MLTCCGYVQGALGPVASFLREELGFSYTLTSLHLSAFAGGMVLAGASASRFGRVLPGRGMFWVGGVGLAFGALGVGMSHSATQSILASLLTGALACWAVVVVQAALAERHGAQRTTALTEANLGGSLGSILSASFLATFAASHVSWRLALAPPVLTVVVLLVTSYREPIGRTLDPAVHSGRSAMPRRFWAFWTTLLLGVGIEWSITFWAVSYLQDALYLSKAAATTAAGGMFAAIVLGRLVGSRLTRRYDAGFLLPRLLIVALVGVWLLLIPSVPVALVGLIVAGFGIANLFPLALSLGIGAASESSMAASACCTAAVGLALMIFPLAIGRLADTVDIRTALQWVVPSLVALALAAREQRVWELFKWVERSVGQVWRTVRSSVLKLTKPPAALSPPAPAGSPRSGDQGAGGLRDGDGAGVDAGRAEQLLKAAGAGHVTDRQLLDLERVAIAGERAGDSLAKTTLGPVVFNGHEPAAGCLDGGVERFGVNGLHRVEVDDASMYPFVGEEVRGPQRQAGEIFEPHLRWAVVTNGHAGMGADQPQVRPADGGHPHEIGGA